MFPSFPPRAGKTLTSSMATGSCRKRIQQLPRPSSSAHPHLPPPQPICSKPVLHFPPQTLHFAIHFPLSSAWVMYRRACNILQSHASGSQDFQPAPRRTRTLTPHQVVSRWRSLALKLKLIFQMIATQSKVKKLLGEPVFNRWFAPAMTETVTRADQPIVSRVIKGQAVGRRLAPGEGKEDKKKAHMEPAMCQHPEADMQARGNKGNKWWFCTKCMSRWVRTDLALVNSETPEPNSQDLVTFGKHMGKTYEQVLQDPPYCNWIMDTVAQGESIQNTNLLRLAEYIHHVQVNDTYAADGWADLDQL